MSTLLQVSEDISAKIKAFRFRRAKDIACHVYSVSEESSVVTLHLDEELGPGFG